MGKNFFQQIKGIVLTDRNTNGQTKDRKIPKYLHLFRIISFLNKSNTIHYVLALLLDLVKFDKKIQIILKTLS